MNCLPDLLLNRSGLARQLRCLPRPLRWLLPGSINHLNLIYLTSDPELGKTLNPTFSRKFRELQFMLGRDLSHWLTEGTARATGS